MLSPRDTSNLPFVGRGLSDEQKGANFLCETLRAYGKDVRIREVGLLIHPKHNWLGATPDRIAKVEGEDILVEIKNWYVTAKQNPPRLALPGQGSLLEKGHTRTTAKFRRQCLSQE